MRDYAPDVLVVEDDRRVAQFIKRCLTLHGYGVSGIAASAAAALAAIEAHLPALLIVDIRIEGPVDGVELVERIRERWPLPVVYVTGQGDDETVRRAVSTGPFGFVRKPFDDVQLRAALEVALHQAAASRQRDAELQRTRRESGDLAAQSARVQSRLRKIADVVGVPPAGPGPDVDVPPQLQAKLDALSPRERDVLRALLAGHRVASLARALSVSPYTVRNHLRAVFRKVGVHSQEELIETFRDGRKGDGR
jgi:DNA-binding NarL/FixJ family response regulator